MFKEELDKVPRKSGCYLMHNKSGIVIYVGKAKILQNRLRSYFRRTVTGKTKKMVSEVAYFEYIVTNNEKEAFILELNLIKKYDPKYNILLRDDKTYPYIEFTNEIVPRLIVKREVNANKKNTHLFGPYPNCYAARRLVNLINRLYPLRKCKNMGTKPCLYYHIGECLGYCQNKDIDIKPMKDEILSILNGNDKILINKINEKIEINSKNMNYEVCKELKEELDYINETFRKQTVEFNDGINRDIVNYYSVDNYISIVIMFIRNGKLIGMNSKIIPLINEVKDTLEYFIASFYTKNNLPKEIIVPDIVDNNLLEELISTKFIYVYKGPKHKLFEIAYDNAKINYENNINKIVSEDDSVNTSIEELKSLLNMNELHIIEAFDNSNLFGTNTVSGMVCFIDGVPSLKNYRKFKLSFEKNDDVSCMKEVIYRRYFKVLNEDLEKPDLIIVDGGINQINACNEILNSLNLDIKVIGVIKDNKHTPSKIMDSNYKIYDIDKHSYLYKLISKIDEEVHRFTINYHRDLRSKKSINSILDDIKGLGKVRKDRLLSKYKTIDNIKMLSIEELSSIIPECVAKELLDKLKKEV